MMEPLPIGTRVEIVLHPLCRCYVLRTRLDRFYQGARGVIIAPPPYAPEAGSVPDHSVWVQGDHPFVPPDAPCRGERNVGNFRPDEVMALSWIDYRQRRLT